jgi:predicted RNase H-like nuclease (RuvC/YqgF family)
MAAVQNFKVMRGWFGQYKSGSVLPEWVIARAGSVEELVRKGTVEPTHEPVNVSLKVPEPKAATIVEPPAALVEEMNELRTENIRLAGANKDLTATVAGLRAQLDARDKSLGNQTEAIENLKAETEEHQDTIEKLEAERDELRKELDQLTAPAA